MHPLNITNFWFAVIRNSDKCYSADAQWKCLLTMCSVFTWTGRVINTCKSWLCLNVILGKTSRTLPLCPWNEMTCGWHSLKRPWMGHNERLQVLCLCWNQHKTWIDRAEQVQAWGLTCLPSELIVSIDLLALFRSTKLSSTIKSVLTAYRQVLSQQWAES